jgi:hypothetical protein
MRTDKYPHRNAFTSSDGTHPGGSNPGTGKTFFFFKSSRPVLDTGIHPRRVKLPGREVDHSSPSSAKVKNEWCCTSNTLYALMAWRGKTLLFITFKKQKG